MKKHKVKQGSPQWHRLRLGKVTGSRFKQMMSNDNLSLLDVMVAEQIIGQTDESDYVSDEMQRGTDLEPLARKEYERITKKKVQQVGFISSTTYPLLGLSPDGLVGRMGATEIKCPNTKNHVKTIRQKKVPSMYKYQVLAHFIVNEKLQWVDFVSYDPRFHVKPIFILRVTREEWSEDIKEAEEATAKFFAKFEAIKSEIIF